MTEEIFTLPFDNILLCTCHPDDEAMFFNPTIQYFLSKNIKVYILCLSTGNYDGLGKIRVKELKNSCNVLGIELISIIDSPHLQDGWKEWAISDCTREIKKVTKQYKIQALLSFDEGGISGHPNHKSLSTSVYSLREEFIIIFLFTRPLIPFKYLGLLAPNHSSLTTIRVYPWRIDFWKGIRAMLCHKSQLISFRYLYLLFSSYMYSNILNVLHAKKKKEKKINL